jgi:hypothetical protein
MLWVTQTMPNLAEVIVRQSSQDLHDASHASGLNKPCQNVDEVIVRQSS